MKICTHCKIEKNISEFYKDPRGIDGLYAKCKCCHLIVSKKWQANNREKIIHSAKKYRAEHIEQKQATWEAYYKKNKIAIAIYQKEYREKNKAKRQAICQAYQKKNPAKVCAATRKYQIAKINAQPAWANFNKIQEFYDTANSLNMLLGEWHSVDHIVPLTSKLVCGLHCEQNLQILTASQNSSKGNRYWPDMPERIK